MNKRICDTEKVHSLKEIRKYVLEEKWKVFTCELERIIKEREEEAFMEGYCYAIQILQDSFRKKIK